MGTGRQVRRYTWPPRARKGSPAKRPLVAGADLVYPDRHSEPRGLQAWRSARRPSPRLLGWRSIRRRSH